MQPEASRPTQGALVSLSGDGELKEVERTADFSVIEITKAPQGSVASSLFALRGACAVLRARDAALVASEALPGTVRAYRLRFPSTASPAELSGPKKSVFSRAECAALGF